MSDTIHLPGSGAIRVTTDADVSRAVERVRTQSVRPARALTASAMKLSGRADRDSMYMQRMSQPWQLRALAYYDMIGEIRFASQFYAKLLSRVRFYPARLLDDGRTEPITSGPPVDILHRLQDPGGGRSRLQYDYGRLMFVTGEGVLFVDEANGVEQARFLWKDEVRRTEMGNGWERVRFDKTSFSPPEIGQAYRFWTPHPRHSDEADAPLRSVLDIAEELLILTAAVRSTAVSRMTNGIMVLPTELSPNPYGGPGTAYEGDEDGMTNPLLADWYEHTEAQKENPGSAEAAMSFTLEGAYEYLDRVRWMATHDNQTDYMEKELRREAVWRMSIGMDFPPEWLTGMGQVNHWGQRQIVYDIWRSYGIPVAERFGDDVGDSYLRPLLEEENYPEWESVVVANDDSKVVIPPDMTEIAKEALDRIAIGRKGYRTLIGAGEELAPDEDEEAFLASLKLRQPVEIADGELVIPQRGPLAQQNGNQPEDGPPNPTGGRDGSRQESRTASALIQGAALAGLMRCRELAGIRIGHKCAECVKGVPLSMVASAVDSQYVTEPVKLVQGGSDSFLSLLKEWGLSDSQAIPLCQHLEVWAAKTISQPRCPELPPGFVASIERAKDTSRELIAHENSEAVDILLQMTGGE